MPAETDIGAPARFALPALVDAHVHLPPWWMPRQRDLFLALFLAHGVTTVRDVGSLDGRSLELRAAVAAGTVAGPRIRACGPILDGDPPVLPVAEVVRDEREARQAVAELARRGVDCVKTYRHLSHAALAGVASAAAEHGLPVVGHLPLAAAWDETRIAEIQHVCEPRCGGASRTEIAALVEAARVAGLRHTPTLTAFAGTVLETPPERADLMPSVWRDVIWNPAERLGRLSAGGRSDYLENQQRALAAATQAVRQLREAGVPVLAGTDPFQPYVVPGASLWDELARLEAAGFPREEAWQAASTATGPALGIPQLGRIEAGAPADFLIFERDPLEDASALDSLITVVANGRVYSVESLRARVSELRASSDSLPIRWILYAQARALAWFWRSW
ncbi:MAG: amidohydrolase family protein [Proteobacteria bacterium]|nr:amidohydrolase family protein [Pseudomonadota bacterium]